MASFRKEILQQIERIDTGRIFTFGDLSFPNDKLANVAVLLSEQSKKCVLVRIEKGAYFRPRKSALGLGSLPVYFGESLLHRLDLMGICVSTGSACDSKDTQISHVLKAIGLDAKSALGTIRISLGKDNSEEDVKYIAQSLIKILKSHSGSLG